MALGVVQNVSVVVVIHMSRSSKAYAGVLVICAATPINDNRSSIESFVSTVLAKLSNLRQI